MNRERFQAALNYIGDDLIAEAADCKPSRNAKPKPVIKYAAAAVCTAAAIVGAFALRSWLDFKADNAAFLQNSEGQKDIYSIIISALSPINSEDSSSGIRFSPNYEKGDPTLEEWRGFHNVIWNTDDGANKDELKSGGIVSDSEKSADVEPGSVKISDKLYKLAAMNPHAVYAVRVSFEPCRSEAEMNAWKYRGVTIEQIKEVLNSEGEAPIADDKKNYLIKLLDIACYDYYLVKMQEFYETFKSQNLEIYPIEQGSADDYSWFYCFIGGDSLNEFVCKSDEAFVFDLAER